MDFPEGLEGMTTVSERTADIAGTKPRTDGAEAAVRQEPTKRLGRRAMAACVGLVVAGAGCWVSRVLGDLGLQSELNRTIYLLGYGKTDGLSF